MQVNPFPISLEHSYMLSPTVKHFIFRCDLTPAFDYLPGQFITIHFEHQGKTLRRSYSIANIPRQDNRIEFAASYIENGPGTDLLFRLNPGDTIQINGPFGRLTLKDDLPQRYIFVATSTGVTPYRAMQQTLSERLSAHPELEVVILLGVQKREDILYVDEWLNFALNHPRVTFRAYLSRESSELTLHPHESLGRVHAAFPTLQLNPEKDIVYLCGNPAMIDDAFTYLKANDFDIHNIIREKYISAK